MLEPKQLWKFDRDESVVGYSRGFVAFALCVAMVSLISCCDGCIQPTTPPIDDSVIDMEPEPIEPLPDPISDDKEIGSPNVAMSFSVPPELWELIAKHMPANAVTFAKAIKINADGLTVDAPAGVKASFDVTSDKADVTFSQPFPTVSKWKLWSKLHGVVLRPDGSGIASTGTGNWKFRWCDDLAAGEAAPLPPLDDPAKPIVLAWSLPNCQPCERAKRELTGQEFDLRWDVGPVPSWAGQDRPFFWWSPSGRDPRNEPTRETKKTDGYLGKEDFLGRWRTSRAKPTTSTRYRPHTNAVWWIAPSNRSGYIWHLMNDGIHRGKFTRQQLNMMTDAELLSLHADDHQGTVDWSWFAEK